MSRTIQISEKSAALLAQQAAAHGKSMEAWIEELAMERALISTATVNTQASAEPDANGRSLVERVRELRAHVKPDPEGWTVKDYINYGRH